MKIEIFDQKDDMGAAAAAAGIAKLKETLAEKGSASIIVATGVSQFQVLAILAESDLPWNKITAFHLDEYVGCQSPMRLLSENTFGNVSSANCHFLRQPFIFSMGKARWRPNAIV